MKKKIKFVQLTNNNRWKILLSIIVIVLFLVLFDVFENTPRIHNITMIAFALISIYFLKSVFYKNYVEWNKKSMMIKTNYFRGKNIIFDRVARVEYKEDEFILFDGYEYETKIDLKDIDDESKAKLKEILETNI